MTLEFDENRSVDFSEEIKKSMERQLDQYIERDNFPAIAENIIGYCIT